MAYYGKGSATEILADQAAPNMSKFISAYVGNSTGTAPPAGNIGEQIRSAIASGSAVSLTTATPVNITSISLTPGVWDVSGIVSFTYSGTIDTISAFSVNATSATIGTLGDNAVDILPGGTVTASGSIPAYRVLATTNISYYLVASSTFSIGSVSAYGRISATRVA